MKKSSEEQGREVREALEQLVRDVGDAFYLDRLIFWIAVQLRRWSWLFRKLTM